jgi:hypothetical protein
MVINRIHLGSVVFARTLAASIAAYTQRSLLCRPTRERRIHRVGLPRARLNNRDK